MRVLLAGNDILGSEAGRVLLEAMGYQIFTYTRLPEAIALVLEDPPDVLIVARGFDGGRDQELLQAVKGCVQKANIPIILVVDEAMLPDLDWGVLAVDDFVVRPYSPELLLLRIRLAESRMLRVFDNNPLSKLPGNTSILRAIQKTIDADDEGVVCYVDIDNFKPYNDRYGFSQGDDVILMVARIMVNVIDEMARDGSFVGHVGGDDFVFIVREEKLQAVCERILSNFEVVRNMFVSPEDVKAGGFVEKDRQGRTTRFGLLSLSIAAVPIVRNKFKHSGEVAAVASQLKHEVKKLPGSNYMIDRRSSYNVMPT